VKQLYDVEISPTLISEITADLDEEVKAWQTRRLRRDLSDSVPGRPGGSHSERIGTGPRTHDVRGAGGEFLGKKELLGLWLDETEGAKFWLSCLTDLKNRGVNDLFWPAWMG